LLTERHTAQRPSEGASLAEIEAVYRTHYARFIAVAAMLCRDPELGRDAVQDGFASAIRSRTSFRGGGSLEGWLWRIVVNAAHSAARRPRRVVSVEGVEDVGAVAADADSGLALLAELPERQRAVLFLRYYAELDYRTIAEVLDMQVGTVGSTANAALAVLRRKMTEGDS
jgi:RNA polymerase sigma factor (sigma-70 family)